jgi:hypothetical protein
MGLDSASWAQGYAEPERRSRGGFGGVSVQGHVIPHLRCWVAVLVNCEEA